MKRVKGYVSTRPLGSYDFEFFVEDSMTDQEIKNKVEDMLELSMHYDVEEGLEPLDSFIDGAQEAHDSVFNKEESHV